MTGAELGPVVHAGPVGTVQCKNIWKVFGPNPTQFFSNTSMQNPTEFEGTGHIAAVRDVTLDVENGETFVIMGLSGSGKSTLVRCISLLIKPTRGSVVFEGLDLTTLPGKELNRIRRSRMGMVFQSHALFPHETVMGNVAFPLEIQRVDPKQSKKRAHEMISLVGLNGRENDFPYALSGGERQRVGIARALSPDPHVLLLDEPFSALDPLIRRELQQEVMRLQSVLRKTIIFITHDFDEAIRLADRIAIMKGGQLIQVDTPENIVLHPANDYVREFTKEIARAKVVTAGSVMHPLSGEPKAGLLVRTNQTIEQISKDMLIGEADAVVVDDQGEKVGQLSRRDVVDVLLNLTHTDSGHAPTPDPSP